MKIKKIISRSRRDFAAIYECEHCGSEDERYGYDDTDFHKEVIPNMECQQCGKKQAIQTTLNASSYFAELK